MKPVCAVKYFNKLHYKNMFDIMCNQLLYNTYTDKKEKYVWTTNFIYSSSLSKGQQMENFLFQHAPYILLLWCIIFFGLTPITQARADFKYFCAWGRGGRRRVILYFQFFCSCIHNGNINGVPRYWSLTRQLLDYMICWTG
jgi:hypothetical protein